MSEVLGIMITRETYEEYLELKKKNQPMQKVRYGKRCCGNKHCPVCGYVVDNAVPPQNYCDNCGQRLKD